MTKRFGLAGACALAVSLCLAGGAAAVEPLDGTWEAKLACKGVSGAAKDSYKLELELLITQPEPGFVHFSFQNLASGEAFVLTEMAKPGSGRVGGISCELAGGNSVGVSFQAAVKTKEGSDKATLSGTLLFFDGIDGELHTCKLQAKRATTTNPNLGACP